MPLSKSAIIGISIAVAIVVIILIVVVMARKATPTIVAAAGSVQPTTIVSVPAASVAPATVIATSSTSSAPAGSLDPTTLVSVPASTVAPLTAVSVPVWAADNNTNYVNGQLTAATASIGASLSADGNDIYLGPATSQDQCQSLCAALPLANCGAYTWVNGIVSATGGYANQCYGLKNNTNVIKTPNNYTMSATRSEGFWPKLSHIMGSQHAGDASHFSGDPGTGTFEQGYARPTFLPSVLPPNYYLRGAS